MNRLKNKQTGFSLIEIMVVVAIIGIIATIAIPNYSFFQRRAKQVGAKTALSGIYAAQMAFISEWDYGTANLRQLGYEQNGESYYMLGWRKQDGFGVGTNVNSTTRPVGYRGPLATNTDEVNTRVLQWDMASGALTQIGNTPILLDTQGTCQCDSCDAGVTCNKHSHWASCDKIGTGAGSCNYIGGGVNNSNRYYVTFSVGAVGNIGGTQYDKWTINQNKEIINTQDGTE